MCFVGGLICICRLLVTPTPHTLRWRLLAIIILLCIWGSSAFIIFVVALWLRIALRIAASGKVARACRLCLRLLRLLLQSLYSCGCLHERSCGCAVINCAVAWKRGAVGL
jgi:hypothetical protein